MSSVPIRKRELSSRGGGGGGADGGTVTVAAAEDPEAVAAIKSLAQQHDCVALQLLDPAEEGLPGAGFLRAREVETGKAFVTRGGQRWVDTEPLRNELRRGGVDHLLLRTDASVAHELRSFFKSRGLLGRGAR